EVFEKLAAGCILCIIDELIDDLSGRHARSQFIESVGKLVAAGFGLSFKLLAVRHSHSSSVAWLRPRRAAAAELFYSASDFSGGVGICRWRRESTRAPRCSRRRSRLPQRCAFRFAPRPRPQLRAGSQVLE